MIFEMQYPVFQLTSFEIPDFWIFYFIMAIPTFIIINWVVKTDGFTNTSTRIVISIFFAFVWVISLPFALILQTDDLIAERKKNKALTKKKVPNAKKTK